MSVYLNNKVGVKIGSTDLSDHVKSVTINRSFQELDVTAMGDQGVRRIKGLEDSNIAIEFINDTASSSVLQTLQGVWGTNATITLLNDKATSVSATNPLYTALILVNNTQDINGAVGDLAMQSITFNVSGAITVATSGTF